MKHIHLTTKYRPQIFAQVAGQDSVRTILSRAAETDQLAPAYMFSGTRGVGKTTLARILAKAINCMSAPAAEPCNECSRCKQITQGAAVDVVEIDGASNRGIEQARRLKEDIGFAPLECRYKVIIIDEAHMLTREAFNALLKTLEEPPGHATFILATTEPHKFPPTIISRCQHFSFQRLSQSQLEAHLTQILGQEQCEFEPSAVRLLAQRGAGSVRDSMSLLSQVLSLGGDVLTEADVRSVLGLASFETMLEVVKAVSKADCLLLSTLVEDLLKEGLDLGFFLRELGAVWRNLFLLRQCGDKASGIIELPEEQVSAWMEWAKRFSLPHLHACLQMTLEGQRRVLTSLEPAQALELLLLNLAYLPRLMPVGDVDLSQVEPETPQEKMQVPGDESSENSVKKKPIPDEPARLSEPEHRSPERQVSERPAPEDQLRDKSWGSFLAYAAEEGERKGQKVNGLSRTKGEFENGALSVSVPSRFLYDSLCTPDKMHMLTGLCREFYGDDVTLQLVPPKTNGTPSMKELKKKVAEDPLCSRIIDEFQAQIVDVRANPDRSSSG
jgi:DNA polymerase-3 subunit gamma/tau